MQHIPCQSNDLPLLDLPRRRGLGQDPTYHNHQGKAYFDVFPSKPQEILSTDPRWRHNGDLIWAVAQFGWLDGHILDMTLGAGVFWKTWAPDDLTTNDIRQTETGAGHGFDFANGFPTAWGETFDAVVLDPPYKTKGSITGPLDDDHRYGLLEDMKLPGRLWVVGVGLAEAARMVKPGGWVHVKCQNQTAHHRYRDQVAMVVEAAGVLGLGRVAEWGFVNPHPRPQGRHVTPRNNMSTLVSFQLRGSLPVGGGS